MDEYVSELKSKFVVSHLEDTIRYELNKNKIKNVIVPVDSQNICI